MGKIVLSRIFVYPVKSLGGIELQATEAEARGLRHDRRWMLVDEQGVFLTQRKHGRMALVRMEIRETELAFAAPRAGTMAVPLAPPPADAPTLSTQVWRNVCDAQPVSREADGWLSDFLEIKCRLVYMPESTRRAVNPEHARNGEIVSFADGYPALLVGQASLDELNARIDPPAPLNRFRPNLVVTNAAAFAEYGWGEMRIGAAEFRGVKPCERCIVTTIDQATGQIQGPEPLKTLAKMGQAPNKALFGLNLLVQKSGRLEVGQTLRLHGAI